MTSDLSLVARRLLAGRGFVLFTVLSIAVGISVTGTAFALLESLLWRPVGLPRDAGVVTIKQAGRRGPALSWPDLQEVADRQRSFESIGGYEQFRAAISGCGDTHVVFVESVDLGFFGTVKLELERGRTLDHTDYQTSRTSALLVSERFWRSRCGADPTILGKPFQVGRQIFEVVGIVRRPFLGLTQYLPTDIWIPAGREVISNPFADRSRDPNGRNRQTVSVLARLRPGVSEVEASSEVTFLGRQLETIYPQHSRSSVGRNWTLGNVADNHEAQVDRLAIVVLLAIGVVLSVASTNIANLAFARGMARRDEMTLRYALGASRIALVRLHLLEIVPVAVVGFALGLLLMQQGLRILSERTISVGREVDIWLDLAFTPQVVFWCAGMLFLVLVVSALWPSIRLTSETTALRSGWGVIGSKRNLHRALLVWQVAASVALLVSCGFMVNVLAFQHRRDSGIAIKDLVITQVDYRLRGIEPDQIRQEVDRTLARLAVNGRFDATTASVGLPFGVHAYDAYFNLPHRPFLTGRDTNATRAYTIPVTSGFFRTLGIPLVAGVPVESARPGRKVVVISESTARALFGSIEVLGRELVMSRTSQLSTNYPPEIAVIVGIAADTDVWQVTRKGHVAYIPLEQVDDRFVATITYAARTRHEAGTHDALALEKAIREINPEVGISSSGTAASTLSGPFALLRLLATIAAAIGTIALALAMTGLYGVLRISVERRFRELGLRAALGAEARDLLRMTLLDGLRPVVEGLMVGFLAASLVRLGIRGVLALELTAEDTLPFLFVLPPLLLAWFLASYAPARRAARMQPAVALRDL